MVRRLDQGTAPFRRIDIGNALRKRPAMAGKVFGCILPLAVWIIGRRLNDPRTVLQGALIMGVHICDSHHY